MNWSGSLVDVYSLVGYNTVLIGNFDRRFWRTCSSSPSRWFFCYTVGTSNHEWFSVFLVAELRIKFSVTFWLDLYASLLVPYPVMRANWLITAGSHLQDRGASGLCPCISYLPVPPPKNCCTHSSHTAPCYFYIVGLHLTVPPYR